MTKKDMKRTHLLIILAAAFAVAACGSKKTGSAVGQVTSAVDETVRNVEVTVAESRPVPQENIYSSTVEAWATNNIAPQTAGRIRKINVEVGDYVYKGQVLAEMDRFQLEQSRLQVRNDSIEYVRLKSLLQKGGVTQSDFDAFQLAYDMHRSSYENLLENTVLKSPVTGYVSARNYDRNDMYSMAQPLFTVQQVVPVKLLVGVSESEYTKVKKGDQVTLTVDALPGRTFTGKVSRLYPTINPATHTFNAEVTVNNTDRALRPGMYARVKVTFGVSDSVVLPDQTVVKQEGTGQRFVYIVNDDSTVSYVPVTLGRHIGPEWEIREGVVPGQTVVVKGQAQLKDGSKVNIISE